ncbi:hypothetical protein TNCT_526731 [Trichonephila clavata]|uniref:Uncharacterized protein n=1 Tax=Trichonephila clavata TaxID=2740835 RepID=A0A8X6FZQ6_TRICU|nr:hypothetical protein TNCT_526731 [Trichonephila clavata]
MLLAGSTRYPSISSNGERNSPHAAGLTLRFTIHFYDVRKGTQSEAFASVDFERAVGHREDQAGSVAEQMRDSPEPPERPGEPSRETGCVPPKREIHGPGVPSTGPIRDGSPHRKQPPASPRGSVQRVPPPDPNLRRGWPERKSFGSLLGGTILEAGHPIGSNRRPAELHRIPTTAPPARQHGHVAGFARDVVVVPVRSAVDGSRLDERQHRGPAEAGDTRSRRTQHGTNQRRVTPSEATAGPQSSTKLGRRRLPPDNMDTLQASHATSSSFRSAPQSTAVASTRGNIAVPPKREIHGPGEPSTGRYKYDHPGYQSTGYSHMPLPKRPHRSPNSDANKTCPVPGFARDVVTVRSAVDLLGGGPGRQSTARDYSGPCPRGVTWQIRRARRIQTSPRNLGTLRGFARDPGIDLSRYLGNDFDLRSSAAPGVRGRRGGERILPHFFTSKSWEHRNPSTENVAPRRAPGDDSTTARPRRRGVVTAIPPGHHSSGSFAGTERAVRRRNEETANPPPGPDRRVVVTPAPPEHHLSRYDATPLSRGTERVVRRRNEETANPPPGPDRRVVVTPAPPEHHLSRYDATPLSRGTERVVRRRNEETANPPPGPDRRVVVTPAPPEHHLSRSDATPLSRGTEKVVRRRNEETANPPLQNQRRAVVTPTPPEHDAFRFAPRHRPEGCPGGTQGPRARRRVPGGPPRVIPKREKEARERSSEDRRHHSCTRTPPREREESSCRTSEVQLDRAHTSPYIGQLACQLSWKRSSSPVRCGMMLADGEGRGQNLVQFLRQNVGQKIHFWRKNGNFQRTLDRPRATSFSGPLAEFRGPGTLFRGVDFGGPETSKIRNSGTEEISARNRYRGRGPGISFPRFDLGAMPPRGSPGGPFRKTFFFCPFRP